MEEKKVNPRWYAQSLEEFYFYIGCIYDSAKRDDRFPLLWFRGLEYDYYNLSPSLFRGAKYIYNAYNTYSNNHLREDYRYQHFKARNYNNLECEEPDSIMEWLEIMQHHFSKTRLMDWSESAQTALLFALESYINPLKDRELEEKRNTASPTVWILDPAELNKRIYRAFLKKENGNRYPLIENALRSIVEGDLCSIAEHIGYEMERTLAQSEDRSIYLELINKDEHNMDGIISLSALEWIKRSFYGKEIKALERFELNPFFYLLLRYYSDGVPVKFADLPPLAVIHPYHSQRIRAQKGAFTVFPYYIPDAKTEKIRNMKIRHEPMSMENISCCQDLLYEIKITNPRRIARELLMTGERRGNLYPEMQVLSQEIENGAYYV